MGRPQMMSDAQWALVEPLLPKLSSRGRPWKDNREVFEGILWILRTGARWKDLPPGFPSPATCWRRLRKWDEDGTWLKAWRTILGTLDEKGRLDWEEVFIDGSFAPAKKGGLESARPSGGRERSGWWWSTARVFLWESPPTRPPRRKRVATVNLMRGMVKAAGARLPRCASDRFAERVACDIPQGLVPALEPLRQEVGQLDAVIEAYDEQLELLARDRYPETRVLTQVPGVGTVTALTFVLVIDDPGRFRKSRDVGPALGLVPRRDQSGDRDLQLRITKVGVSYLRMLLVEAAQKILQERSPDTDLKRWGLRRAERGGRVARKRAIVAVARRLAVLLHRLWVSGAQYEPLRNFAA